MTATAKLQSILGRYMSVRAGNISALCMIVGWTKSYKSLYLLRVSYFITNKGEYVVDTKKLPSVPTTPVTNSKTTTKMYGDAIVQTYPLQRDYYNYLIDDNRNVAPELILKGDEGELVFFNDALPMGESNDEKNDDNKDDNKDEKTILKDQKLRGILGLYLKSTVGYNSHIEKIAMIVGWSESGNSVYAVDIPLDDVHTSNKPGLGGGYKIVKPGKLPPVPTVPLRNGKGADYTFRFNNAMKKYFNDDNVHYSDTPCLEFKTEKVYDWRLLIGNINDKFTYNGVD